MMIRSLAFTLPLSLAVLCLPLASLLTAATPTDWPKLVQDPYVNLPLGPAKLTPLPDTADVWKTRRGGVMAAWLKHLRLGLRAALCRWRIHGGGHRPEDEQLARPLVSGGIPSGENRRT